MADIRILAIPGALRKGSFNRMLARAAVELAPEGVEIEIADLVGIPVYDGDVEAQGHPAPVRELRERITSADGVLILTPEYNHGVPGVLKNAIDWLSRGKGQPFQAKIVALAGASNGRFGTVRAQLALRPTLACLDARVLPSPQVHVTDAPEKFDAEGRLSDERTRAQLANLIETLVERVRERQALAKAGTP